MGFVTKSSMMADYQQLFWDTIKQNRMSLGLKLQDDLSLVGYLTPEGILIEIVKDEMDSHSVDQYVIASKLITIPYDIKVEDLSVTDFEHKEGWGEEE
jgi:hypothetical protein